MMTTNYIDIVCLNIIIIIIGIRVKKNFYSFEIVLGGETVGEALVKIGHLARDDRGSLFTSRTIA